MHIIIYIVSGLIYNFQEQVEVVNLKSKRHGLHR